MDQYLYLRFYWVLTLLQHQKSCVFTIYLRLYDGDVWGGPPQILGIQGGGYSRGKGFPRTGILPEVF